MCVQVRHVCVVMNSTDNCSNAYYQFSITKEKREITLADEGVVFSGKIPFLFISTILQHVETDSNGIDKGQADSVYTSIDKHCDTTEYGGPPVKC